METSSVGVVSATPQRNDRGLDSLKSEDFFQILVTELQQQDPLDPSETSDMISQVSDIRSIELSSQLNSSLDALASQQRTANAPALIGKYVSAVIASEDGSTSVAEGVVTGVRFDSGGTAILELDTGHAIKATDVERISDVSSTDAAAALDVNALAETIAGAVDGDDDPADANSAAAKGRQLLKPWNWLR